MFFIIVAIVCGGMYYAYSQAGNLLANIGREAMVQAIEGSELPADQKTKMTAQIDRVANGYKAGEISFDQVTVILQKIGESSAISAIPVEVCKSIYIAPSGLSDEEKADANQQLQRITRGMFNEKIAQEELDPILEKVARKQGVGNWKFEDKVTDDQLREMIEQCKILADAKNIPDEKFEIDLAEELKKSIDEGLAQ